MSKEIVHTQVSEVMTPYLITTDQYCTLAKARELMLKNSIRRIPVTEKNSLIGIITMSDILEAKPQDLRHSMDAEKINEALSGILVDHVMSRKPISIFQTDTLGHAAEIMLDSKIGGLPVVDADNKLVGLITESDIFRTIVRKWRDDNLLHAKL